MSTSDILMKASKLDDLRYWCIVVIIVIVLLLAGHPPPLELTLEGVVELPLLV